MGKKVIEDQSKLRTKKPPAWYRIKDFDLHIISLYLVNFWKFVTSKSSRKNELYNIQSVYMMSSEFGPRSEKSMLQERVTFQVEVTN